MMIAVLSRHGRLLALCGLSAALHLLLLDLVAHHGAAEGPAPLPGAPGPLLLRLAPRIDPALAQAGVSAAAPTAPATGVPSDPADPSPGTPAAVPTGVPSDAAKSSPGTPAAAPVAAPAATPAAAPTGVPSDAANSSPDAPVAAPTATPGAVPAATPGAQAGAARATAAEADAGTKAGTEAGTKAGSQARTEAPSGATTQAMHATATPPAAVTATATASPASPAASDGQAAGAGGTANDPVALHYRVRMPPAVHLAYTLTRRDKTGVGTPLHAAFIDWRTDGERYTLEMDGVLGRLSSSGVDGDDGIQPASAGERQGERLLATRFDPDGHRILLADGGSAPSAPGMQDRASLLMQLAGIGLARAAQLQGGQVLQIVVAGSGSAQLERYQVMGEEDVDTGLGRMRAWHLAQIAAPGAPRLEIWLAPAQGWLPVQLRSSDADGGSATQILARAEPGVAP